MYVKGDDMTNIFLKHQKCSLWDLHFWYVQESSAIRAVHWFLIFCNRIGLNFIKLVNKNYVNNKLKKRRGKCKKCGKCCKGCKFLDKKTHLCKVYNKRPWLCYKEFPLDELDQKIIGVKDCGYFFKKK